MTLEEDIKYLQTDVIWNTDHSCDFRLGYVAAIDAVCNHLKELGAAPINKQHIERNNVVLELDDHVLTARYKGEGIIATISTHCPGIVYEFFK
jgi:hypothetical protein